MRQIVLSLVYIASLTAVTAKLEEVFKWKHLDWKWSSNEARENAIKNGEYIPGNSMPNGMLPWKDKLFVTVPRWKAGVPSTLNYVSLKNADPSPVLIPYPNWESNNLTKENAKSADNITVSIFRIDVDPCDRLWVLDTGVTDVMGNSKIIHPPTLIIYNLQTDTVIRRFTLKPGTYSKYSVFAHTIVDATADKCNQSFAYLPDIQDNQLIVYSFADNDAWKVSHNYFHFEPLKGDLKYLGLHWQWHDGIFSIALGPTDENGFRTAYFHTLVGTHEFSVNTSVLQNKTLATNKRLHYHLFKIEGKKGENALSSTSTFDVKTGVLFTAQMLEDGIGCWNAKKSLNHTNFGLVAQDHNINVFPNDVKIDEDRNLWILTDKMPMFMFGKMDLNEVNFRCLKIPIDEAINGTVCEP